MKINLFLILLLAAMSNLAFSNPDTLWTKKYGGNGSDWGLCVQLTADNGFIIVASTGTFGAGGVDIWVLKTDSNGDTMWTRTYGTELSEGSRYIEPVIDGGYIIAGSKIHRDIWLLRIDYEGDTLWTRTYSSDQELSVLEAHQTADSGYIIGGYSSITLYSTNWMLIKTDAAGIIQWMQTYGDSTWNHGLSVQATQDRGYVMCGDGFAHLIKTDSLGHLIWERLYSDFIDARFNSVVVDSHGGYVMTGAIEDGFHEGLCFLKTDDEGNLEWYKLYGGGYYSYAEGYGIESTSDGGYIACGIVGDYLSPDLYIVRVDSIGDALWTRTYRAYGYSLAYSVRQIDSDSLNASEFIVVGDAYTGPTHKDDVWLLRIGEITSVEEDSAYPLPESFGDLKIYPNPTNAIAKINYGIAQPGEVILSIYNILGQRMYEQTAMHQKPGTYSTSWDGSRYPSGIYLVRVKMGNLEETKRLLILK